MSTSALEKLVKAKALPLGHIDRKKAEEEVGKIYKQCSIIERFWERKLPRKKFSPKEALDFCNHICSLVSSKPIKDVLVGEVPMGAGACYRSKHRHYTITFKYDCIYLTVLIHELCHHLSKGGHGKEFCEIEVFIFALVYEMLTGKKPKPDWEVKCYGK